MTLLVIFYMVGDTITKKTIDHTDWTRDAPQNILKVWIKKSDGSWLEFKGWGAYYFKDVNGKPVWGGINAINQIENFGTKRLMAVEDIFPKDRASAFVKYGIEVSRQIWNDVDNRRPE